MGAPLRTCKCEEDAAGKSNNHFDGYLLSLCVPAGKHIMFNSCFGNNTYTCFKMHLFIGIFCLLLQMVCLMQNSKI